MITALLVKMRRCPRLIVLLIALTPTTVAVAGIDVTLSGELTWASLSRLEDELRRKCGGSGGRNMRIAAEIKRLRNELPRISPREAKARSVWIKSQLRSLSCVSDGTLQGRKPAVRRKPAVFAEKKKARHFPGSKNRVAVFTFEDPDGTGLGDALSLVLSKQILFNSDVHSKAVVNIQQGVSPDDSGLGYFEKVEKVTQDQGYFAVIWGRINKTDKGYVIDTYLKFDTSNHQNRFEISFPAAQLDKPLQARVAPNRVWVQSLTLSSDFSKDITLAADEIRKLRTDPSTTSSLNEKRIDEGFPYWLSERDGPWVQIKSDDKVLGWTSVVVFCRALCEEVLGTANFVSGLMNYATYGTTKSWKINDSDFTIDANAIHAQTEIIVQINKEKNFDNAQKISSEWIKKESPSSGANFDNFLVVALVGQEKLNHTNANAAAERLARATLGDPGNLDALNNLSTLFRFLGDNKRSNLAENLYNEHVSRVSKSIE